MVRRHGERIGCDEGESLLTRGAGYLQHGPNISLTLQGTDGGAHAVACAEKLVDAMGANKSRAAGDEYEFFIHGYSIHDRPNVHSVLFCPDLLPQTFRDLAQDAGRELAGQSGEALNQADGDLLKNFCGPLVEDAAFGAIGEALSKGGDALVGGLEPGLADEAGVLVLFEKVHLLLVLAIEQVDPFATFDEGLPRVHLGSEAVEEACHLEDVDALVQRLNDLFLAREVVINETGTSAGSLGDEGHWSFMKATFHDDVEHRIEDGVALARLCFGCHAPIVPRQARHPL